MKTVQKILLLAAMLVAVQLTGWRTDTRNFAADIGAGSGIRFLFVAGIGACTRRGCGSGL